MPSGQGSGRHGRHEETVAVKENGYQGTAPAAHDKAVATSAEANTAVDNEVKVWGTTASAVSVAEDVESGASRKLSASRDEAVAASTEANAAADNEVKVWGQWCWRCW